MDAVTLALVVAGIGAGGAIIAALIGAWAAWKLHQLQIAKEQQAAEERERQRKEDRAELERERAAEVRKLELEEAAAARRRLERERSTIAEASQSLERATIDIQDLERRCAVRLDRFGPRTSPQKAAHELASLSSRARELLAVAFESASRIQQEQVRAPSSALAKFASDAQATYLDNERRVVVLETMVTAACSQLLALDHASAALRLTSSPPNASKEDSIRRLSIAGDRLNVAYALRVASEDERLSNLYALLKRTLEQAEKARAKGYEKLGLRIEPDPDSPSPDVSVVPSAAELDLLAAEEETSERDPVKWATKQIPR